MKRRSTITILTSVLLFFSLFLSVQYAAATSRKDLLKEFCLNNQDSTGGFLDTPNGEGTDTTLSEFTAYANLYILSLIEPELDSLDDKGVIRSFLRDRYILFSDVGTGEISQVYYAYLGGLLVGTNYTETLKQDAAIELFSLQNQTNYGFSSRNSETELVSATYYATLLLNEFELLNSTMNANIASFIMSCWDDGETGFKSAPEGQVSLVDTYMAVATLAELDLLSQLSPDQVNDITTYIEGFYFDDETYTQHYGGYGIQTGIIQSSLLYTYYCVETLDLLGSSLHEETLAWVLARQNPNDYGFIDVSSESANADSSAKLSYYAVRTILTFDENAFSNDNNAIMNEEIWDLSTNPWAIAGIVLGVIAILVAAGFGIYKYQNRI